MTKKLAIILSALLFFGGGFLLLTTLKGDEVMIQVRYLKLACERCNHMEVERSNDKKMKGVTVIPLSKKIDIETLIEKHLKTGKGLCFLAKPYLFNFNLFNIDPDGNKIEVIEALPLSRCMNL